MSASTRSSISSASTRSQQACVRRAAGTHRQEGRDHRRRAGRPVLRVPAALKGHEVTIFDEHEHLGGMMRYGIPGFRTPREVLDAEIQRIIDMGVEARLKTRVGTDVSWNRSARTSTRCSSAWARNRGGRCRRPAATRRTSSPPRRSCKAFNDGRLRQSASAWSSSAAATPRSTSPPWRGAWATSTRQADGLPSTRSPGIARTTRRRCRRSRAPRLTLTSVFNVDKMQANKHEIEQARPKASPSAAGLRRSCVVKDANGRGIALRVASARRSSSARSSRSRSSKAPRKTSRPI